MDRLLDNLMTLDELCEKLDVKPMWVYRQTRLKAIPHMKLGKYLRFYRPAIEEWLKGNGS